MYFSDHCKHFSLWALVKGGQNTGTTRDKSINWETKSVYFTKILLICHLHNNLEHSVNIKGVNIIKG